jgi:hypothetical protein
MKYGPFDQSIVLKLPEAGVPDPITTLTRPILDVVSLNISVYTLVPLTEPCKILIYRLTFELLIVVPFRFLTTA